MNAPDNLIYEFGPFLLPLDGIGEFGSRTRPERERRHAGLAGRHSWCALVPHIVVSAARSEPFGLSIVEAMAAGLPVVAAASEGALEIIEDGLSGKLVPVGDAESLAEAINDLLDDPFERSRLGRNALIAARQRYSLARMVSDTERVYHEVLTRN